MVGIGAAVVVVIILIVAFSGGEKSSAGSVNPATLNEKEKYAMFSAEVACDLVDVMRNMDEENMNSFIQETLRISEEAADKYGYTLSEVEAKRVQYENDEEFRTLATGYVMDICPEIAAEAQIQ
jgi:hypothetical protein